MSSTTNSTQIIEAATASGLILGDDTGLYVERQIENGWPDLEPSQIAFAHEYVANGYSHRNAAEKINRAASSGLTLLRDPLTRAYISYLQREQHEETLITTGFVEAQMMRLYEMAIGDEEVNMVDSDGHEFTAKQFQGQLAFSIVKEFGNSVGYSKVQENNSSKVTIHLDVGALTGRPPVTIEAEDGEIINDNNSQEII